ncbi:MAG: hypothetical protein AVDCRST_MAG53-69, partial [uncultured Solirubrobacteraceae bacterium]
SHPQRHRPAPPHHLLLRHHRTRQRLPTHRTTLQNHQATHPL